MLVKNGTAFIGGHFTRADVRVENGKIAQIGDLQPREGEEIRSAAGLYVLPGLVDIHIHACSFCLLQKHFQVPQVMTGNQNARIFSYTDIHCCDLWISISPGIGSI